MTYKMERIIGVIAFIVAFALAFLTVGCEQPAPTGNTQPQANTTVVANTNAAPSPAASPSPANESATANLPVTLPVLDAMFADENFAAELKTNLGLTDEQVEKLKQAAREAREGLNEGDGDEKSRSTAEATRRANEQIRAAIGDEKARQLAQFVSRRWQGGETTAATGQKPNAVPTDTRIVVNAPAFRMDLFKDGQLVRSYKIGIGYPEFPLPTGMRKAETIIFNPTWTPPDEPWVKGKVQPGKKVEAGSKLNPLGPIKIPIGAPSLIHGGKNPARLGNFASHGCVGLTSPQVQDFSFDLAQLAGMDLTQADVANYEKNKTETKNVKLSQPVMVELRYETIVVEDGKLKVFRDVYEHGTNTEENLRKVLDAHGVSFDSLSEEERAKILDALKKMARDAQGNPADPASVPKKNTSEKETKTIKGEKEIVIELPALAGKGYPAPVNLHIGAKSKTPMNAGNSNQSNANKTANANNATSRRF